MKWKWEKVEQNGNRMDTEWWRNGGRMVAEWWPNGDGMVTEWWRNGDRMVAEWWRNGDGMLAEWLQNGGRTVAERWQNDDRTVAKRWQNSCRIVTEWSQNDQITISSIFTENEMKGFGPFVATRHKLWCYLIRDYCLAYPDSSLELWSALCFVSLSVIVRWPSTSDLILHLKNAMKIPNMQYVNLGC